MFLVILSLQTHLDGGRGGYEAEMVCFLATMWRRSKHFKRTKLTTSAFYISSICWNRIGQFHDINQVQMHCGKVSSNFDVVTHPAIDSRLFYSNLCKVGGGDPCWEIEEISFCSEEDQKVYFIFFSWPDQMKKCFLLTVLCIDDTALNNVVCQSVKLSEKNLIAKKWFLSYLTQQ